MATGSEEGADHGIVQADGTSFQKVFVVTDSILIGHMTSDEFDGIPPSFQLVGGELVTFVIRAFTAGNWFGW